MDVFFEIILCVFERIYAFLSIYHVFPLFSLNFDRIFYLKNAFLFYFRSTSPELVKLGMRNVPDKQSLADFKLG